MSGNIYTRDATTPHLRSGGFLNNNLWASNTAIYDFGRPNASLTYSITNDVYLENIDQPGVFHLYKHGWLGAFVLFNSTTLIQRILPPGSVTISNNIFANSLTTNHNGFAVAIMGGAGFPMPAPTKFFNNIVYMWNYGPGGMAGLHSPIWDQFQHRHDQYQHWAHPKN